MNYVCNVVGTLVIEDVNLELQYMEMIDLSPADFKASPKLREAHRRKQLVPYDAKLHRNAKRFTSFTKQAKIKQAAPSPESSSPEVKFSDAVNIKESLGNIANKMDSLVNRVNILITRSLETSDKLNDNFNKFFESQPKKDVSSESFNKFIDKTLDYHSKMEELLQKRNKDKDDKIDELIVKLDEFIEKGIKVNAGFTGPSYQGSGNGGSKKSSFDDTVTFVPDIQTSNIKTSVKTQELQQEGTDSILAKLKALKK